MKIERGLKFSTSLDSVIENAELLIDHCRKVQEKVQSVVEGTSPEEETLDEVGKMKGKVVMYGKKVRNETECILNHY